MKNSDLLSSVQFRFPQPAIPKHDVQTLLALSEIHFVSSFILFLLCSGFGPHQPGHHAPD